MIKVIHILTLYLLSHMNKNEDHLKNKDDIKKEEDLNNKENLKNIQST